MSDKLITFRVDENLKNAFEMVAKNSDLNSSQMLRAFMRETVENYMKENRQVSLLENKKPAKDKKQKSVIPDSWRHKDGR